MSSATKTPFALGRTVMTCSIDDLIKAGAFTRADVLGLIAKHSSCDWGEVCKEDAMQNDAGLNPEEPDRLHSVYTLAGTKIWVITEYDRSTTTVLLPDDY